MDSSPLIAVPDVLIHYQGIMTNEVLKAMVRQLEASFLAKGVRMPRVKKINAVLIECLQNLIHHAESLTPIGTDAPEIEVAQEDKICAIRTRNLVSEKRRGLLQVKLDSINQMDSAELRSAYKAAMESGEVMGRNTAGLGFLDVARKSADQQIHFNFEPTGTGLYFFDLRVRV